MFIEYDITQMYKCMCDLIFDFLFEYLMFISELLE